MADATRYRLVLIPEGQVSEDGCRPGTVKLTGTPGQGEWDAWGPYRSAGTFSAAQAEHLACAFTGTAPAGWVTGPGRPGPLPCPGEGDRG